MNITAIPKENYLYGDPTGSMSASEMNQIINELQNTIEMLGGTLSDINDHQIYDELISNFQSLSEKGAISGYASLNSSQLVVENPANATATPTAGKIPIADGSGKLDGWITPTSSDAIQYLIDNAYTNFTPDVSDNASLVMKDKNGADMFSVKYDDADSITALLQSDKTGTVDSDWGDISIIMKDIANDDNTTPNEITGIQKIIGGYCASRSYKEISLAGSKLIRRVELSEAQEGYTMLGIDETPASPLHVKTATSNTFAAAFDNNVDNANAYGIRIKAGSQTSGTLVQFDDFNDSNIGAITHSSGTVSYGAFTGWHPAIIKDEAGMFDYALIEVESISDRSDRANIIYNAKLTTKPYSKRALGVASVKRSNITDFVGRVEREIERMQGKIERKTKIGIRLKNIENKISKETNPKKKLKLEKSLKFRNHNVKDIPHLQEKIAYKKNQIQQTLDAEYYYWEVFCLGNGLIWVTNENSNLEYGNFLVSSSTAGMTMKADDTLNLMLLKKTIVAKITEDVDWSLESDIKKLVSCIYLGG